MHHVALNGAGANQRDLHHEIVKAARLEPWQRVHLRATLHLKYPHGVGAAEIVIHRLITMVELSEVERHAARGANVFEAVLQHGQYAKPEQIDLDEPHGVEVVLLPLDDGALIHRRGLNGHHRVQRFVREHKAAHMNPAMPRCLVQTGHNVGERSHAQVVRVETGAVEQGARLTAGIGCASHAERCRGALCRVPITARGQRFRLLHRKSQHPRGIAHGAAPAPGDVLAHHRRVLAAIAIVDVLQDALAVAMRKINVNVRRFFALFTQKTLKEQLELDRIHCRDAECVAHRAVGRGAAPLTENSLAARKTHNVPHNQEIAGEPQLADERELVLNLSVVLCGAAPLPPLGGALLHELCEIRVFAHTGRERKGRQCGFEIGQPKRTSLGNGERGGEPCLVALPPARHLRRPFEIPLAVGAQARAHVVERRPVPQRHQHVVCEPPRGLGVMHIIGDHPRHIQRARERHEVARDGAFFWQRVVPALNGYPAFEHVDERGRRRAGVVVRTAGHESRHPATRAAGERKQSAGVARERVEIHARSPARVIEPRPRDERTQVAVSHAVLGEQHEVRQQRFGFGGAGSVHHLYTQLHTDQPRKLRLPRRRGEPHHAADVVVIGERERAKPKRHRARHELLWVRGPVEHRERGVAVQFGVRHSE